MKKIVALLLVLMLTSAFGAQAMTIGVMSGPTGMGMAQLMAAENDAYSFEIYSAPTDATADLASGTLDLLCLPTNTAASLSIAKEDYISVAALNCLGTLYLLTDAETEVNTAADLAGMTITAGVATSTTGPILDTILAGSNTEATVEWEADHDAVVARMIQGDIHVAVLPEPKATVALTKAEGWKVALNLSAEWDKVVDTKLPMGCIVVRNQFLSENKEALDQFLTDYSASIAFIADSANRKESAAMIAAAGILPAEGVAMKALGNLEGSIVYEDGAEMKADLQAFFTIIGQQQPADAFYYEK